MILVQNTLISEDIFEKQFICNLNACKGACCVEGDSGAPLLESEIYEIENNFLGILPYLSSESQLYLQKDGIWVKDKDGDIGTTCRPSGECNFAYKDGSRNLCCGIEKAWNEGNSSFQKPISCHLYPIRISKVGDYDALNYHRWDICSPACKLGKKEGVSVFEFLKDALIRKYGAEWYDEVNVVAKQFFKHLAK
jgi:hypothetical protein